MSNSCTVIVFMVILMLSMECVLCQDIERICQYANIKQNSTSDEGIVAPNVCLMSLRQPSDNTFKYYNYQYECNATNNEYFIQRIYDTNKGCTPNTQIGLKYFYRKDGYDFNCSDSLRDCSAILQHELSCEEAPFNDTSYVCGQCFKASSTNNEYKSSYYSCWKKNYDGNITHHMYHESDNCSINDKNVTKKMQTAGCKNNGDWFIGSCHMPKNVSFRNVNV